MKIPGWLHEVFGESQSATDLTLITAFGLAAPLALVVLQPDVFLDVPRWRAVLSVLLIADVAAGCVANLTAGTNDFYAARPLLRWVFIAVHVHILAVAFLLKLDLMWALGVWAYTIVGATLVNLLLTSRSQRVFAGVLFAAGGSAIVLVPMPSPVLACVGLMFMLKVMVNFAVDHRAEARRG